MEHNKNIYTEIEKLLYKKLSCLQLEVHESIVADIKESVNDCLDKLKVDNAALLNALKDLVFTASKLWDDVKCIKDTDSMTVTHPIIEQAKAILNNINNQ